jgi:hypothetical protein
MSWSAEASHRAKDSSGLRVWDLALDPYIRELAQAMDPSGELLGYLDRICAERAGGHLIPHGSRTRVDGPRRG